MRNRLVRGLIAFGTVVALLTAGTAAPAGAITKHRGDRVCNLYANSNGFGAYCSAGSGSSNETPKNWNDLLGPGRVFIPCRDFEVPRGLALPAPPEGKTWVLRLTIVDYDLTARYPAGGADAHIERAVVPVSAAERDQCPPRGYMDVFWTQFHEGYPAPALVVKPTYTPRVNVPAHFSLTSESSLVMKETGPDTLYYGSAGEDDHTFLTMRAVVTRMRVDPGDGTGPFDCLMGVDSLGGDGYDETKDPFQQVGNCKHVYKRSSASQPGGMYTVKLTVFWEVAYWKSRGTWVPIGTYPVEAVQRLPVQEVQAIGG